MSTSVVESTHRGFVTVVRMTDRARHNALTPELSAGLTDALDTADGTDARAIVLAGLADVFNSGAVEGTMRDVVAGRLSPGNADAVVRGPARAAVPVVAAARGHAVGGGLLLALYCDAVVLSERSFYSVPFARFGLTPVQGATFLLRSRFGDFLGGEMLMSGRRYQGSELRKRGAPVLVVPHAEVETVAIAIADELAAAPRHVLEPLKRHLAGPLLMASRQAMEDEQALLAQVLANSDTARLMAENWIPGGASGRCERSTL